MSNTPPEAPGLPRLVLRADGGCGRGLGHINRCLALADAWHARGGRATLAVSPSVRSRASALAGEIEVVTVDDGAGSAEDAGSLEALIDATAWLVLDGYGFGPEFLERTGVSPERVVVIDDHGRTASRSAALLVDHNHGATAEDYCGRPSDATLLLGAKYALLRRGPAITRRDRATEPRRLLVVLGGDPLPSVVDLVAGVLGHVSASSHLESVVIGGGDLDGLADLPDVDVRGFVADPRPFYESADIALAAAGTVSWELCRHGLPAVLLATVGNQEPVVHAVASAGAALAAGPKPTVGGVVAQIEGLLADASARTTMADQGRRLVDGEGADRVVAAIRSRRVHLRSARPADARLLWRWVNEPGVRAASFTTDPVPWSDHERWFESRLASGRTTLLVAEDEQGPWGQIRFEVGDDGVMGTIDVSVDAERRGEGLAAPLIRSGLRRVFADRPELGGVRALIRRDNDRSATAFLAAGLDDLGQVDGVRVLGGSRDHAW